MLCSKFPEIVGNFKKEIRKQIDKEFESLGINFSQSVYIGELFINGQETKATITKNLGFDKANTTRMISDLNALGLVETDNNKEYKLSKKGEEIAIKISKLRDEFEKRLFNNITSEEAELFKNVLLKIWNNLLNTNKGGELC